MDVRRNVRLHVCGEEGVAEALGALAAGVVELAEHHEGLGADVTDVPRLDDEAHDAAESGEDVLAAGGRCQLVVRVDPVFQRDDDRLRTYHGSQLPRRLGDLPRLDRDHDRINDTDAGGIIGCMDGRDDEIARDAVDAQAAGAERFERGAAREKRDVETGMGKTPAEVAADAAGADERDSHGRYGNGRHRLAMVSAMLALVLATPAFANPFTIETPLTSGGTDPYVETEPRIVLTSAGQLSVWNYHGQLRSGARDDAFPIPPERQFDLGPAETDALHLSSMTDRAVVVYKDHGLVARLLDASGRPLAPPLVIDSGNIGPAVDVASGVDRTLVTWLDSTGQIELAVINHDGFLASERPLGFSFGAHVFSLAAAPVSSGFVIAFNTDGRLFTASVGFEGAVLGARELDQSGGDVSLGASDGELLLMCNGLDGLVGMRVTFDGLRASPAKQLTFGQHQSPKIRWDGQSWIVGFTTYSYFRNNITYDFQVWRFSRQLEFVEAIAEGVQAPGTGPDEYDLTASPGFVSLIFSAGAANVLTAKMGPPIVPRRRGIRPSH